MGMGISVKCSNCDYLHTFMLGVGMNDFCLESICETLHHKVKNQVQALIKNYKIQEYDFDRKLAYCEKCNKLYNKPVIKIKYDDNHVFKNSLLCSKCKNNLTIIENIDEVSELKCPKCGEITMQCFEYILWD